MKISKLFSSVSMLFLSSCGIVGFMKTNEAYQSESITNESFVQEIPFEEIAGAIIVQVEIEGHQKKFIFDTGATCKIDKRFAGTLKLQKLGKVKTYDSNNKKKYIQYVKADKINLGDVSFFDLVASVSDMEPLNKAFCADVCGIIGANAMNKGVWQIDYLNKFIRFTNYPEGFEHSDQAQKINFSTRGRGTPEIQLASNGTHWGDAIIDTGSNGRIGIPGKFLPGIIQSIEKEVYVSGIFSETKQIQNLAIIPIIQLNRTFTLSDQLVFFQKDLPFGIIGNRFLKDYMVTINWFKQEIILDPYHQYISQPKQDFGFYPHYNINQVVVGSIRLNSPAYNKGIRLNDTIVRINDTDFSTNSYDNFCNFYSYFRNETDNIELTVLKENKEFKVVLEKSDVMEILKK